MAANQLNLKYDNNKSFTILREQMETNSLHQQLVHDWQIYFGTNISQFKEIQN